MWAAGGLLGSCSAEAGPAERGPRPNVLFILIDDLGWADAGCLGSDFYETPNIDRLRRQSVWFSDAYMASCVCAPSRASIMTGKYPARFDMNKVFMPHKERMTKLIAPRVEKNLPAEEMSIAEALRPAGYATAAIGKWHLGGRGHSQRDQGFNTVVKHPKEGKPGDYKNIEHYTDAAIAFMKQNRDRPFFVYLAHDAMHHDFVASEELIAKYRAKVRPGLTHSNPVYAANLEHLDRGVGRLLGALDDLGLSDKTVVVFTSDNGGRTGQVDYRQCTDNAPLKHGKHTLYEGGIRVPLMVRWPGVVKPNSTCATPVHSNDFLPTLADVAGAPGQARQRVDGVSLVPLLKGAGAFPQRSLFWYYPYYLHSPVRWRARTICMNGRPCAAVRDGDYKLVEWLEDERYAELYNVREDVGEKTNLADVMPEKAADLRRQLHAWFKHVNASLPTLRPKYKEHQFGKILTRRP